VRLGPSTPGDYARAWVLFPSKPGCDTSSVDRFGPNAPRSPKLIKHRSGHLNKGPIFAFNNTILRGHIRRGKLMLESKRSTKGCKLSIFELCVIVTAYSSHGIFRKLILQPKNQISSMSKSLILRSNKDHPRVAREVVDNHKHIPLPSKRANPGWTNSVHMKQFARMQGHHLGDQRMGSGNHFAMMIRVIDKIFLKF
jgi:hypothetical protein